MYKNGFGIKSRTIVDMPSNQTKKIVYDQSERRQCIWHSFVRWILEM